MASKHVIEIHGIKTEFESTGVTGVKPEIGDYVKIVAAYLTFSNYHNGDVLRVVSPFATAFHMETPSGKPVEPCIFPKEFTILKPTGIVLVNGQRYRKLGRPARVGDTVLVTSNYDGTSTPFHHMPIGALATVNTVEWSAIHATTDVGRRRDQYLLHRSHQHFVVVEKVVDVDGPWQRVTFPTPTPTTEQRLDTLEARVDELAAAVAAPSPTMVPQQTLRDKLIADAKADWARLVAIGQDVDQDVTGGPFEGRFFYVSDVKVDSATQSVTVTVKDGTSGSIAAGWRFQTGTATIVGGVFNAHLAKIIALYRALGLDVPSKYTTNVPQPEGKRVGDFVEYRLSTGITRLQIVPEGQFCSAASGNCQDGSCAATSGTLVDDTARYGSAQ